MNYILDPMKELLVLTQHKMHSKQLINQILLLKREQNQRNYEHIRSQGHRSEVLVRLSRHGQHSDRRF